MYSNVKTVYSVTSEWEVDSLAASKVDPLLDCLALLTVYYGNPCSADILSAGLPISDTQLTPELLPQAAIRAGLNTKLVRKQLNSMPNMLLPCILLLKGKKALVLHSINAEQGKATVSLPETSGEELIDITTLESQYVGYAFLVKQQFRGDHYFDTHIEQAKENWIWQKLKNASFMYKDVIIASVLINIFALVSPLFVMNIYDKIVPNLAFESLWVLAIGASIVYVFDLVLKQLRSYLIDIAGKRVDIEVSSSLFSKIICMPLEQRPPSVGGMAKQIGEFDSIREFLSSATIATLVDLPFALLFMFCIWLVAGDLVLFPIIAGMIIISFTCLRQSKLRHAVEESNRYSSLKHGHLIESLHSIESIKANGAEGVIQNAWQQMIGYTSTWLLKSKQITNSVMNVAGFIAQIAVVSVVVLGVYRVSDNAISMGGIIAAVMLTSRAISPFNKLAALLTRVNQVVSALRQLDSIMKIEGEFENKAQVISRTKLSGNIEAENLSFKYPNTDRLSLHPLSMKITHGEKVAIVGHNGSGKTTLAKLLLGLYQPTNGRLCIEGLNYQQIHPSDLRRNIGYLPQDITLFHGSVRDNILFGTKQVTEFQLIRAVQLSGVSAFTNNNGEGLDQQVGENGKLLSRGQRQSIALARAILNSPEILLLDEPTASLDARAEKQFIESISATAKDRTLLLITHKTELLKMVDRILVMDQGKLVLDGRRDEVLAKLMRQNNVSKVGS